MVCEGSLPKSTGGGPRLNLWAVSDELRMRGHEVQVVYLTTEEKVDAPGIYALGSRRILVNPMNLLGASPSGVAQVVGAFQPDVIFGLGSWNIAWASAYDSRVPRVLMVGDPEHVIHSYRRQYVNREPLAYEEIANYHQLGMQTKAVYLNLMRDCAAVFCGAGQSVEWFRSQGLNVEYIPMPIVEPAFPGWRRRKEDMPQNEKPRILMAGHLGGIATLSGLYYLLDEVLPYMPDYTDYDWNICGGEGLMPSHAQRFKMHYPEIKFRGYMEDIRKEMLQSDIFFCPTSSVVGVRTRIVEAWALGSCVVAHAANGVGQPEVEDRTNIVLEETGMGLAEVIRTLAKCPGVRYEMGHAARQTFEDKFRTELSAGRIIDVMEQVVS